MTGLVFPKNSYRTDWDRMEDVFELWADRGHVDREVTEEELMEISSVLRERYAWAREISHGLKRALVRWLRDPKRYSPWVDDLNVERAVQFRRPAWESLTTREYREAVDRLTEMIDPFETKQHQASLHSGAQEGTRSGRMDRFYRDFSREEQRRITFVINNERNRRK